MAHLPMDLVNILLLRLPASTLVGCRVLSKPCISLIDSPDFVASHLKRTIETGDHLMILLRSPSGVLRTVYVDAPDNVTDVENPLQSGGFTEVFGSCNGLIVLMNSLMDMALFNPSTRKIHRLVVEPVMPNLPKCFKTRECVLYGLGYDSVSHDYKVLRMIHGKAQISADSLDDMVVSDGVKVFSLKTNSWKEIIMDPEIRKLLFHYFQRQEELMEEGLYRRQSGVLVNNSLHWLLPREEEEGVIATYTILRFDLVSEEFQLFFTLKDLCFEDKMDIGVLDGCLCVMGYIPGFTHVDVWIQKHYDLEGDWTKLFRVTKPESVASLDFMTPLLYSKDRTKVLLEINVGNLVWFDFASKSFETLGIMDCDGSFSAQVLVSSLVLGCNGDPRRARGNQMVHKSNKRGDGFLSKGFKLKL